MDEIKDLIDELIEKNNLKLQIIHEISAKTEELGLNFVANDQQLKYMVNKFISELKELKNQIK